MTVLDRVHAGHDRITNSFRRRCKGSDLEPGFVGLVYNDLHFGSRERRRRQSA